MTSRPRIMSVLAMEIFSWHLCGWLEVESLSKTWRPIMLIFRILRFLMLAEVGEHPTLLLVVVVESGVVTCAIRGLAASKGVQLGSSWHRVLGRAILGA